jgi:outer membrane immunogenic protein
MKKFFLSSAFVAVITGSAFAADLPSIKSAPVNTPAPSWTGFYAGINAGINVGTNASSNVGLWNLGSSAGYSYYGADVGSGNFLSGIVGSQNSSISQTGFIGGGQLGYNYQFVNNVIVGFETDFQGSTAQGNSSVTGIVSGGANYTSAGGGPAFPSSISQSGFMTSSVSSGVSWIGTARARVGYLLTPTLYAYGTAGLSYGDVWANVTSRGIANTSTTDLTAYPAPYTPPVATQGFFGGGRTSSVLVGYSAGGGFEWMLAPNWSLKAEAIYWNLGNMNLQTAVGASSTLGAVGLSPNSEPYQSYVKAAGFAGTANVNYQGIIARAGVNYHFNFASAPVVAKF